MFEWLRLSLQPSGFTTNFRKENTVKKTDPTDAGSANFRTMKYVHIVHISFTCKYSAFIPDSLLLWDHHGRTKLSTETKTNQIPSVFKWSTGTRISRSATHNRKFKKCACIALPRGNMTDWYLVLNTGSAEYREKQSGLTDCHICIMGCHCCLVRL